MSGSPLTRFDPRRSPQHSSRFAAYQTAIASPLPMAIPNGRPSVPPPLPPPTHIPGLAEGRDPGWQWGNDPNRSDFGRPASIKSGSSLLGGSYPTFPLAQNQDRQLAFRSAPEPHSRSSSIPSISPNGDRKTTEEVFAQDITSPFAKVPAHAYSKLHGERPLEQRTLEESSASYDKQLVSRIGGPPTRLSISFPSSGDTPAAHTATEGERRHVQLRPITLPDRQAYSLDSPASSRCAPSGGASPRVANFWSESGSSDTSRVHTRNGSLTHDDSVSHRGSYDRGMFSGDEFIENFRGYHLRIDEHSPSTEIAHLAAKLGDKRRASSPPLDPALEDRGSINGDIFRNSTQHAPARGSPGPRISASHSSISSISSSVPRHGSLGSSFGLPSLASSATSYASTHPPYASDMDYRMPAPLPCHNSISNNSPPMPALYHRQVLDTIRPVVPRKLSVDHVHPSNNAHGMAHPTGCFICECCPKKPRKFDTEEDLRQHESEKQYTCQYCSNRFKNKNEAERHQNSLHLRRHSWSCATLASFQAAFHSSQNGNDSDICGYCGIEFPNPAQWDVRAEHLNSVHKFGECNQAKKFFRADHFRQHLKHSHAGSSGKWTNLLEHACMKDEPMPDESVDTPT